MSGFTYRLYLENGEDMGTFATADPDWSVGDEFFNADHARLRDIDIAAGDGFGDFDGCFVVTARRAS